MPAAVLDTNAVSDLMRDNAQLKTNIANYSDRIVTSVIVIGEIRYGLSRLPLGKKRSDLEARAQAILAAIAIEPVTEAIADVYGQLKASLERHGLNLDDNDLWIASTAMTDYPRPDFHAGSRPLSRGLERLSTLKRRP
jgi:predicted nucleic acid-binding protein